MKKVYKKVPVVEFYGLYEFDFSSNNYYLMKNDIIESIESQFSKVYLLGIDDAPGDILDIRPFLIDDFALHIYAYKNNKVIIYFSILPIEFSDSDLIKYVTSPDETIEKYTLIGV
jgi:hypothetical protein